MRSFSPSSLWALPTKLKGLPGRPLPTEPPVMVMSTPGAPMSPQPLYGVSMVEGMSVPPVMTIW